MTEEAPRRSVGVSRKESFRAVFEQYRSYVYAIVWGRIRTVGTREDAEECVCDVFAEVFRRYDEIRSESLKAYIGTVAKRTAVHRYRMLSSAQTVGDNAFADLADSQDLATDYEKKERDCRLYAAICSLGEPDQTIVLQRYFYDRNAGDIAKTLGMTSAAVRVRLHRALKRLRVILTEE